MLGLVAGCPWSSCYCGVVRSHKAASAGDDTNATSGPSTCQARAAQAKNHGHRPLQRHYLLGDSILCIGTVLVLQRAAYGVHRVPNIVQECHNTSMKASDICGVILGSTQMSLSGERELLVNTASVQAGQKPSGTKKNRPLGLDDYKLGQRL